MLLRTFRVARSPAAARLASGGACRSKHTSMEVNSSGVAIIRLDCQGEKQNTLSDDLVDEFGEILEQLEANSDIKSAVLISGKKDSWIAGANIKMIENLTDATAATEAAGLGQAACDRIAALKKPMVAAIDGSCLGGGLEVALACGFRVATSSPKTVLGVPEVMIGLLPGSGGTQRLPKVVGAASAMTLMLTGQQLKAERAKKMGLIDMLVDPRALERAAVSAAEELAAGTLKKKKRKIGWMDWFLESTWFGRNLMFSQATKQMMSKTKGKYPAPPAILECVRVGLENGHEAGSKVERERFGALAVTPEARALRGLFFGSTECKKNAYAEKVIDFPKVNTVGVLGAGLMGAGIAEVSAGKNFRVLLKDKESKGLAKGEAAIASNIGAKLKKRRMTQYTHDSTLARVVGLSDADASWTRHFGGADLVIEAVFEKLEVKHAVVKEMETVLPPNAIIASNTSTIPIGAIARGAARPQNIVGMHYFSPVPMMPLLEVIPHAGTDPKVTAAAIDVGLRQGKTVITTKDVPGFYVNRCLGPFLSESMAVVQEGADPLKFNKAMLDFGYPVGGLSLGDEVGLDVALHAASSLFGEQPTCLGVRMEGGDLGILEEMVAAGNLGKKTGKGWLDHTTGQKPPPLSEPAKALLVKYRDSSKDISKVPIDEVFERCFLRFVSEAAHCVQDDIIASPRVGDIGAVFGVGFPPFIGGPFMWIDAVGAQTVVDKMERLRAEHESERFAPPQILLDYAKGGKLFHP